MRAYVLSTGDELVRGRTRDLNASEIARALGEVGVTVVGMSLVGDDLEDLRAAIERGAAAADIVVMSGGLGPTEDDCTRRAVADAAGVSLRRDDEIVAWLRERWASRGLDMPDSNLLQADVPAGAEVLPNAYGTAPGFTIAVGSARLFALPGPPREMRGVLRDEALPRIAALAPDARVVRTRAIETFGSRESSVGELIEDLMQRDAVPTVGTTAIRGTIRVILHAEGEAADVDPLLERAMADVRARLGRIVFGEDGQTLPEVVAAGLLATGTTLAVAESCTGGLLAGALTSQPGVSAVFPGGVVAYSNEQKVRLLGVAPETLDEHGAVSEPVARQMATGVRERFGVDIGVGITGVAGPDGGTDAKPVGLVHVALDDRGEIVHRELRLPGDREFVRELTVKAALDIIRRRLRG